jgi:hypothetical protein
MIYVPQMQAITERVNNPAKLIQCIQMLNEEEFAPYVLKSIYDEVDQIIVIVGAVENHPKSTPKGLPLDNTLEIVEDFKKNNDPDNKLMVVKIGKHWESLEAMKQTFVDLAMPGDWLIINDADEFYHSEDIRRVRRAIDLQPYATEFVPAFLHYYRDWRHVYAPGAEWAPQHQRIFKVTQGMQYHAHPTVSDQVGRDTYFSPEYFVRRFTLNNFFIHHFGYAQNGMDDIMKAKQEYYKKELAQHDRADVKFDEKVVEFLQREEPAENIYEVPADMQPDVLKEHPSWGKTCPEYEGKEFRPFLEHELYGKVADGTPVPLVWNCMRGFSNPRLDPFFNHINVE